MKDAILLKQGYYFNTANAPVNVIFSLNNESETPLYIKVKR